MERTKNETHCSRRQPYFVVPVKVFIFRDGSHRVRLCRIATPSSMDRDLPSCHLATEKLASAILVQDFAFKLTGYYEARIC